VALADIIMRHQGKEGPLLPLLHDVQAELGCVNEAAIREIAQALNLTRAEVHGVVSFYHDFTSAPKPGPMVKLCRAEACQARGVGALATDHPRIEPVYCLGLCAVGPAALIGGQVHARLDQAKLNALLQSL
jgi:formate dehydrogenase subunit gamma